MVTQGLSLKMDRRIYTRLLRVKPKPSRSTLKTEEFEMPLIAPHSPSN